MMTIWHVIIIAVVGGFCAIMFSLLIIDRFSKSTWFCRVMGWHKAPADGVGFDGCSFNGTCPRCGQRVMQDSQGNWF
jgi:hypothetical protein